MQLHAKFPRPNPAGGRANYRCGEKMIHEYRCSVWHVVALSCFLASLGRTQSSNASTQVLDVQAGKIRVITVASGLLHPWGLAFLPDGRLLVTEKNGRLRMIHDGILEPDPVWISPTAPGQTGDALHFVAVHPQFAQNRLVYVSYPKQGERGFTLAIARGRLNGSRLEEVREIFVADAWETGGNLAGRIFFSPDAMLYVTVGDRDRI
jgi:aldose sugar dehydrogenase